MDSDFEEKISGISGYKLKNKTLARDYTELVAEVRLTSNGLQKMDNLRSIAGVREVSIMASTSGSVL